jgi:hypothetical protein
VAVKASWSRGSRGRQSTSAVADGKLRTGNWKLAAQPRADSYPLPGREMTRGIIPSASLRASFDADGRVSREDSLHRSGFEQCTTWREARIGLQGSSDGQQTRQKSESRNQNAELTRSVNLRESAVEANRRVSQEQPRMETDEPPRPPRTPSPIEENRRLRRLHRCGLG